MSDEVDGSDRWGNERYVRILTRETADRAAWCWQARALMPWMVVKADGAGLLETTKGVRGLAAITMMPIEVVEPGLAELIADQFVVEVAGGYMVRNYVAVQNAEMSNSQRQAKWRDRKRAESALESRCVTQSNAAVTQSNAAVTQSNAASRGVTKVTADVTPSLSDPSLADPKERESKTAAPPLALALVDSKPARKRRAKPADPTPAETASITTILGKLSGRNGVTYTGSEAHAALILRQLRSGASERDLRAVVAFCAEPADCGGLGWEADPKMRHHLRPETLFGPQTISRYLDPARAWAERQPGGRAAQETYKSQPSGLSLELLGGMR